MKKLTIVVMVVLVAFASVSISSANVYQEAREKEAKKTAAAIAAHRPMSPKLFASVESYMKRNFPEHWSEKSQWTASEEGFKKLGPRGGYILIRWNGKLVFKILDKTEYWIGSWNEKDEVH